MKVKKKYPTRKNRKRVLKYGATALSALVLSILVANLLFPSPSSYHPDTDKFYFRAAVVDQLSLTAPNQTFVQEATATLQSGGFTVDYFSGEKITVEFYRNLPVAKYGIIVLRTHSALGDGPNPPLALFTSELYSENKYVSEQLYDQLGRVVFLPHNPGDPIYFGIRAGFVSGCMDGTFENTIIIAMGCNGLTHNDMAKAFTNRGAKAYIGWTGSVQASLTDAATAYLLRHLVAEKQTVSQAISNTMKDIGPDLPWPFVSLLTYYPAR
jgi:hypothetical protein